MATRSFNRTLRSTGFKQLTSPAVQRRSIISATQFARVTAARAVRPAVSLSLQQTRGVKQVDFAGSVETVYGEQKPVSVG